MPNLFPLYEEQETRVATRLGKAKIIGRSLTWSGSVIFLTRSRKFGRGEKGIRFPIGTPVVRNNELARVTEGRVTHMIVKDGLYRLYAQAAHIAAGSEHDLYDMTIMKKNLGDCAEFLRYSGQLSLDQHNRIAEFLLEIGDELDFPKRNRHKLVSAQRSKQAANTRYHDGRIKPGPGRFVAGAAATHAARRVSELHEICPAVTFTMIRVHRLLERVHAVLDQIWRYFTSQDIEGLPVPIHTAIAKETRDRFTVRMSNIELEEFEVWLQRLFIQPFTELARRLIKTFAILRKAIWQHRRDRVYTLVEEVRKLLRRLRMIRYIELVLLPLLSSDSLSGKDVLFMRHGKLMGRLRNMSDHELDARLRKESLDYLELFREDVENGEIRDAKVQLKTLGSLLATA